VQHDTQDPFPTLTQSHLDLFPTNVSAISDKDDERLYHDIATIENDIEATGIHHCLLTTVGHCNVMHRTPNTNNNQQQNTSNYVEPNNVFEI